MLEKDKKYYHKRLTALHNAIGELLSELAYKPEEPATRSRRNLKKGRIEHHEMLHALGITRHRQPHKHTHTTNHHE